MFTQEKKLMIKSKSSNIINNRYLQMIRIRQGFCLLIE
jgi:hypothetical protein